VASSALSRKGLAAARSPTPGEVEGKGERGRSEDGGKGKKRGDVDTRG
jgi:hypothetical protein